MPSVSKDQQKAAGMALAAKRGDMSASDLFGAAKKMYDSMTEKQLEDFAKTKHKGLPEKVNEETIRMRRMIGLITETKTSKLNSGTIKEARPGAGAANAKRKSNIAKEYQAMNEQIWDFTKQLSQMKGFVSNQKNKALSSKLDKLDKLLDDIRKDIHPLRSGS